MSKRIQISPDSGATWYTFPGSKGDQTREAADIKDTIFGQDYASGQTGLIGWGVTADGLYKGFAGYVAKVMKSGTPTTLTDSGMTLVSGKTYKVTDATKNVLDRATAITVKDNNVAVSANNIDSIDHLFGRVTFASGYTPTGPITISGKYLPMTQVASANGFTLTQTANAIDISDYETVQGNGGYKVFEYGLKTVKLALKGIYKAANNFEDLLENRQELVIEINPDGNKKSTARGFFKAMSAGQSGNVGELEESSLDFTLSVPDQADVIHPFSWIHETDTTLSRAIREALLSWQNGEVTRVNYLADGENGYEGDAVITDLSLSSGLEAMNEFSIKFQGSDAPEVYP